MLTPIPEAVILIYILIYNNYIKYYKYIDISKDFRELHTLFVALDKLHQSQPNTDKTLAELEAMVYAYYPQMQPSERQAISLLCGQLSEIQVSDAVATEMMVTIKKRHSARDLAISALDYAEGRKTDADVTAMFANWNEDAKRESFVQSHKFVSTDIHQLLEHTVSTDGLYWPLTTLNLSLGPLRKGDFGFVFARPETGKTTFLSHSATHMASQMTKPVLWFNNEEQGEKVGLRTFQSALGWTLDEVKTRPDEGQHRYNELVGQRMIIYDDASIHRRDVEAAIAELQPGLIIMDQIDKIKGFDADRPDLVFGRIYQWARELAKTYAPVIGTCQSDGTGEGVKWLTMSHVAEAKTSKQAEADWILGIGRSNESGTESVRYFNISKNKLIGDNRTDPELRHGRFDVWIRPQIARYEDISE